MVDLEAFKSNYTQKLELLSMIYLSGLLKRSLKLLSEETHTLWHMLGKNYSTIDKLESAIIEIRG